MPEEIQNDFAATKARRVIKNNFRGDLNRKNPQKFELLAKTF